MAAGWPVVLRHGAVTVRPLVLRDARAWSEVRRRNRAWLEPWEGAPAAQPALAWEERHAPAVFLTLQRALRKDARDGRGLPFAVLLDGRFVGQVTVSGIVRGAFDSANLGYWVDERVAGRGVTPTAVALVTDHAFTKVGLHRMEVNIRPENAASMRVVDKLGFRREGLMARYLFIDGAWRDHLGFALVREDIPAGVLRRWLQESADTPSDLHGQ